MKAKKGFHAWLFRGYLSRGERLISIAHRSVWVLAFPFCVLLAMSIGLPAAIFFFASLAPGALLASGFFVVCGLLFFGYHLCDAFFDAWLITNKSVISVSWSGLFRRETARVTYPEIREMGWSRRGLLATLFGFGDLFMKTATGSEILLPHAAAPRKVESLIVRLRERTGSEDSAAREEEIKNLLAEVVATRLRKKRQR